MKSQPARIRQLLCLFAFIVNFFTANAASGATPLEGRLSDREGEVGVKVELLELPECNAALLPPHCTHYPGVRTLAKKLEIKVGRRTVFVPVDVMRALYDPSSVVVTRAPKGGALIVIRGGGASTSYTARILASDSRVYQLEIFEVDADRPVLKANYFRAVVP